MALDTVGFSSAYGPAPGIFGGGTTPRILGARVDQNGDGRIVIPGGEALPRADFVREGSDLFITSPDGDTHLIVDYFALSSPPDLVTENGAVIRGDLAARLAGPLAPRQYAQAEGAADDAGGAIGKVDNLTGGVTITRADGAEVTASKGTAIFQDDVIETAADGKLGIIFTDNTTFSLGGDGRMVIDTMIYDAAANTGESDIDVLAGTFSFVSGKIAKAGDDAMTVSTPVATIGIRGTTVAGHAAAEGFQNTITLLADLDGGVGQIGVTSGSQTTIMSVAFQTTTMTSAFVPPALPVVMTAAQVQEQYGEVISFMPTPPALRLLERKMIRRAPRIPTYIPTKPPTPRHLPPPSQGGKRYRY